MRKLLLLTALLLLAQLGSTFAQDRQLQER